MPDANAASGWSIRRAPYPGLRAFRQDEASLFFGRDEQIDGLLVRLEHERLVVVAGESGCGKSSLVRAGLLPALDAGFLRGGGAQWRIADLRPGNRPIYNLAAALAATLQPSLPTAMDAELLAAHLRKGPRSITELLRDCPVPQGTEVLIVVDQFEELIRFRARTDPNEADAFVALLLETVADKTIAIRVILTLRTDYLGSCAIFPGLPEVLNGSQYLIPRLVREQLRETIVNPARVFDGDVDSELANQLINEAGQSQDQLPVLEHALLSMWRQQQSRLPTSARTTNEFGDDRSITLTIDDYIALGGLGEALSNHADKVYTELTDGKEKRIAARLFCALWDEGANGNDTRYPCTVREVSEIVGVTTAEIIEVANVFRRTQHSFLMPPSEITLNDDTVLDIGHESLFRHWTQLKIWIRKEAGDVEHYRRLCGLAREQRLEGGEALADRTLELAIAWRASLGPNAAWAKRYTSSANDFADVEQFLATSQAAQARRKRNRVWWRIFGVTAALIVFIIAPALIYQSRNAEHAELARRKQYSALAFIISHAQPMQALQFALEAQDNDEKNPHQGSTLHSALRASHFRAMVFSSLGRFFDAKFLDDSRIVTVGEGDGLAVWEVATGRRLFALYGAMPRRLAVQTNKTATLAATASDDGTVDLWDLSSKKQLWSQRHQVSPITDIEFSPDGRWLATASDDGTAMLWDVANGRAQHLLIDHLGAVTGLAFSHDSRRLATVGADDRIVLWDTQNGNKLGLFARLPGATRVAFDVAGGFIAAISGNGVTLWDPITQHQEGSLLHSNQVTAVAFSPDGPRVATTGLDGTLRVWDASDRTQRFWTSADVPLHDDGRPAGELAASHDGEASWLLTVAFSANGRELVTTGRDGSAKIWDVEAGGELQTFRAHERAIRRVAYAPARTPSEAHIATASDDGTAVVWDRNGLPVLRASGSQAVRAMGFSTAGTELAVSHGREVVLWSLADRAAIDPPLRNDSDVQDLQFFHSQDRIAVAGNRQVAIWSSADHRRIFTIDAKATLRAVAVSPDDQLIASECQDHDADDHGYEAPHQICLWDAHTGNRIAVLGAPAHEPPNPGRTHDGPLDAHRSPILALCFSPDGTWLASSSEDKTVKIWDVLTRADKATLRGHRGSVAGLAISPDGTMLASTDDVWVRLWNAGSYVTQDGFPDSEYGSESVAFAPDGKSFVAGGHDGVVRVYAIDGDSLRPIARDRTPIHLADNECKRYGGHGCHEPPTALQLANEGRHLLHGGPSPIGEMYLTMAVMAAPDTFDRERDRFASARELHETIYEIAAPIREAAAALTNASSTLDEGSEMLIKVLASARATARRRAEAGLQQVRRLDTGLVIDPADLASRITTLVLTGQGRVFANTGKLSWAAHTFMLTPATDGGAGWAMQAATGAANAQTIRLVRGHLLQKDSKAARSELIFIVDAIKMGSRGPQLLVLLRFLAAACEPAGMPDSAAMVVQRLYPQIDDVEVLVDFADSFLRAGRSKTALAVLSRALYLDPTNDQALWLLGRAQYESDQFVRAAATLRTVSPLTPIYKKAAALAAMITYSKLERPSEGYRWMVLAVDSHDAASWANLAEAAWATNRLREARLMASRVLEARAVQRASLDVELAMRFVLVAALCQGREYATAERELTTLMETAPSVEFETWIYTGSRAAVSRIKDIHVQRFIQALLSYSESRGKLGDPQELYRLLHEARDAQTH